MTALESLDAAGWLRQQAGAGDTDVLRAMVTAFANALMSAEADAACGAEYGQRSEDRTNRRNGYRSREWDTRPARWSCRCRSCVPGRPSPTGSSNTAAGPSRPWSPSWRRRICWGC